MISFYKTDGRGNCLGPSFDLSNTLAFSCLHRFDVNFFTLDSVKHQHKMGKFQIHQPSISNW